MHHSTSYHKAHRHSSYQQQAPPRPLSQAASYGGYGYAQQQAPPPSRGPPPSADPQLWQWFTAVDTDRSGAISVTELQAALVNGEQDPSRSVSDCTTHTYLVFF